MANKDIFYLEDVFPEAGEVFSSNYPSIDEIKDDAIYVLDTNILFVPFDTSEKGLKVIGDIFKQLKEENRLLLPARVAREFAKNRGTVIGKVFLKLRQKKEQLNVGTFRLGDYPLLEHYEEFNRLKSKLKSIQDLIRDSRKLFEKVESHILGWNWDDPVSNLYTEIFTPDVIVEMKKDKDKLEKDLEFRIEHKIPPGFKDSGKVDDGVGDLIVWQTVLEIGKERNKNIILVLNDQKNDWYYKQAKTGLYPRFELFDEYRRYTKGKSISMINFPQLLKLFNASKDVVDEVESSISSSSESEEMEGFAWNYEGSIGKKRIKALILFSRSKEGGSWWHPLRGYYYYENRDKTKITLEGYWHAGGQSIDMDEMVDDKITGCFFHFDEKTNHREVLPSSEKLIGVFHKGSIEQTCILKKKA